MFFFSFRNVLYGRSPDNDKTADGKLTCITRMAVIYAYDGDALLHYRADNGSRATADGRVPREQKKKIRSSERGGRFETRRRNSAIRLELARELICKIHFSRRFSRADVSRGQRFDGRENFKQGSESTARHAYDTAKS